MKRFLRPYQKIAVSNAVIAAIQKLETADVALVSPKKAHSTAKPKESKKKSNKQPTQTLEKFSGAALLIDRSPRVDVERYIACALNVTPKLHVHAYLRNNIKQSPLNITIYEG